MGKHTWYLSGAVVMMMWLGGCVEREITVTSEPEGALVYLNDEEVGRTPLTVPFTYYGVYDVRLEKPGCEPLWTKANAQTPWWDTPGIDLFAEAIPGGKSEVKWHFKLDPKAEVDNEKLIDRARQMRGMTRSPGSTPGSTPSTQPAPTK